jgi:hypothetical protein
VRFVAFLTGDFFAFDGPRRDGFSTEVFASAAVCSTSLVAVLVFLGTAIFDFVSD